MSQTPVFVMSALSLWANVVQTVADVIRTCLGPKSMLKMILDPMGGILCNKNMIELSRTQDEECGDGTTSVIIIGCLAKSFAQSVSQLEKDIHPVVIISAYNKPSKKPLNSWGDLMCNLALTAVRTVSSTAEGHTTVDIKRYARVEKIPGGEIEDSKVLRGVMVNKDITHPNMRRMIKNPRIVLLDCPLEYKKGESQTNMEFSKEIEEEQMNPISSSPKRVSQVRLTSLSFSKRAQLLTPTPKTDLAQHVFERANVSCIRRVRKTDNNRIALAVGATIVNRVEDIRESDVGTECGLFKVEKIGDELLYLPHGMQTPKACTILLRGPSKDILNEIDRNLADAMSVARNVVFNPLLAPGGGATEMAISVGLHAKAKTITGVENGPLGLLQMRWRFIPRTLVQNCGGNAMRFLTELRAKHANGEDSWGVDGNSGKIVDMKSYGLYESASVKPLACSLRVDDVVQAIRKQREDGGQQPNARGKCRNVVLKSLFGNGEYF
ncbi:TCP-1/cpn60 chaperonin family-domain-containing protein [Coprinopsis sp. MPI-PUGE-AT-0042]|nr:TCP-1/cpn60 chaperonin family-domain-containing protein [Coprinopsis sp. MPI-PUGE-AT-0042]